MTTTFSDMPLADLRRDLISALPADVAQESEKISKTQLYLPWSHSRALRLESSLVIGARGVGKSVWSQALQDPERRKILADNLFPYRLQVSPGFGTASNHANYPPPQKFDDLLNHHNHSAYTVWQAVLCRALATAMHQDDRPQTIPMATWLETVNWVVANEGESVAALIEQADEWFQERNEGLLLVFDALDRVSNSNTRHWKIVDKAIRDLLRLALQLKASRRLHAKVFLRTDQYERGNFADIPDLSKLQATRVELIWSRIDLHGLLWQRLTNAPSNTSTRHRFRTWCHNAALSQRSLLDSDPFGGDSSSTPTVREGERWPLPRVLQQNDQLQRTLFEKLAGPWMGKDRRRGVPYLWIVNHLADGQGQTSPRSLLAAIRRAAEDSQERYDDYPLALHYESLRRGVQAASRIRIDEIAEDHPWIRELMHPLEGLSVPCAPEQFEDRWQGKFGQIPDEVPDLPARLPERLSKQGFQGVMEYLKQLGLITFMLDGRINMPDLYRLGFGLGRKGGIKPALRSSQTA